MTMFQGRQANQLPDGVKVATFASYEAAQKAVNALAEADVDVSGMALVGGDVRVVERVIGRLTWGKVAMAGAMRGLTFGLFLGIVFWLLVPTAGAAILAMPAFGVAFGMLLSLVTHSLTKKRRQFQSVQQVVPLTFDLLAPREVAGAAMHKLGPGVVNPQQQPAPQAAPEQHAPTQPVVPEAQTQPEQQDAPPAPQPQGEQRD